MPGHTQKSFPAQMVTSADKMAIIEQIGCGGFGEVFKATHADWGVVAYKKLPQLFIKETKAVKQMAKEVEILLSLRHRNIISICGVIFEEGHYGIVLEHMKYGGLDNFLTESDLRVPLPYKVQLAFDVVLGMTYLHSLDEPIIHGDLKIQNVLVGEGYVAKISDFGLSSWKNMSKTSSRSTSGCKGTVTHVPPERWRNINLPRNQMEDVYAFGILLWEIFTEKTPFPDACPAMITSVVLSGQRPNPSDLPSDLPQVIHNLMNTSWHYDQSRRMPFKEIKEMLDTYTTAETKRIAAAKVDLQRQESSSSETSLEIDGPSIPPSMSGSSFQPSMSGPSDPPSISGPSIPPSMSGPSIPPSMSDPSGLSRISAETNPDLPIPRNDTGNSEVTDFTNIRVDLRQGERADRATSTAVVASSLCARSSESVGEGNSYVPREPSIYEGGGVGEEGGSGTRVAGEEGSGPRVAGGASGSKVGAGAGDSGPRVATGEGGSDPRVAAGGESGPRLAAVGVTGPRVAAEASLCSNEAISQLASQLQSDLNIHPVQESNGRSVQVAESGLLSGVDLRSNRRDDDDHLLSETLAKNVTQPKTVDAAHPMTNAAAAAAGGSRDDAGMPLTLRSDLPSLRIPDLNLRSSPSSLSSSHSDTNLPLAQRTLQEEDLVSNRRFNHSQSVPEEDAILSPDTQHEPRLFSAENKQPNSATDRTVRAEGQQINSNWNIEKSASDNNLDVSQGFYPKEGGTFQRHAHPDKEQPPRPAQNAHMFHPTVPSVPHWWGSSTQPPGFGVNQLGGYSLPAQMNQQPLLTSSQYHSYSAMSNESKGPDRDSRPPEGAQPKVIVKTGDGKEVTIIHNTGSGIQIGNNNTMIINDRGSLRRMPDSGQPPAPSSSPGSAAAAKAPGTKKIIVPDKLVDQEVLDMVSANIGKEWMALARQLGFHDADIDSFNADYHHMGLKETAYQMLREWREKRGPEARMQVLAKALVGVKRHDIALKLASKSPANSET